MEQAALHHHPDLVRRLAKVQTEPPDFFSAVILGKVERVKELLKTKPELIKARTRPGKTVGLRCTSPPGKGMKK